MKRLSLEDWKNIFRNTQEANEVVEVIWLDEVGGPGEWCLCVDCEVFEDGFVSEKEAQERLTYLEQTLL